jgi:hemoglobin
MTTTTAQLAKTPYEMIGERPAIREIVDLFYDLMETQAEYAELRALHQSDLAPMRSSLAGFLTAWMGGPRDWFTDRPGKCLMSAHNDVRTTPETARQWADAMTRAIGQSSVDAQFGNKLAGALSDLALRMG